MVGSDEGIRVMSAKTLKKMRTGVLAGGLSAEREVSLRGGEAVFNALMERGYQAVFIDAREDICQTVRNEAIDVAFLVLHGGWGEDGSIQGMLEVMGIPYTGSGVLASSLAMDKEASKKMFQYHGLSVAPYIVVNTGKEALDIKDILSTLTPPWVVKPAREGSSVGVSIVDEEADVLTAIRKAGSFGSRVIIESYIKGREVQIGILGDEILGGVEVRPKRRFYDYKAKYTPGLTEYILPPELDARLYERTMEAGLNAHRALGCKGVTRVDLLIDGSTIYVLEVNTIPGMTETSLLPKIARLAGYDFPALIEKILLDAFSERHV